MHAVIVRYELDPDRLDEHLALIGDVFDHLRSATPAGVHYGVMKSADGTAFTHIGIYADDAAQQAASGNEAFQAFLSGIGDRCIDPPHAVEQVLIENYEIFG